MTVDTLIEELIDRLNADEYFADMKIAKAYPNTVKPTRLGKIYIALGINEINLSPCQLDSSARAGEVSVFADIFAPISIEADLSDIFMKICKVLSCYSVTAISAERVSTDRYIQANVLRTTIRFSDELVLGGEADE